MWEDPIVKEVHDIRKRLAAEHGFDLKAIFADIYKRQALLGERLVSPTNRASTAEAGQSHAPNSPAASSEAVPAA